MRWEGRQGSSNIEDRRRGRKVRRVGAGMGHHAQRMKNILEEGDVEEALNAANTIGDDRLQRQARGYVVPESFTHGTSEQRMRWFSKGLQTGDLSQGDTFGASRL